MVTSRLGARRAATSGDLVPLNAIFFFLAHCGGSTISGVIVSARAREQRALVMRSSQASAAYFRDYSRAAAVLVARVLN